jgi:hypothetical protein
MSEEPQETNSVPSDGDSEGLGKVMTSPEGIARIAGTIRRKAGALR